VVVSGSALQFDAVCCSALQCVAVRCSLLQCVAASSVESTVGSVAIVAVALQCVAVRVAVRCSAGYVGLFRRNKRLF